MDVNDSEVIGQCLRAAADGPFFDHREFQTLFGLERAEVRAIAAAWPNWDDPIEQSGAVNNSLNHLLGYPHELWNIWHDYLSVAPAEVADVYARWRDEGPLDHSGKGYLDRMR